MQARLHATRTVRISISAVQPKHLAERNAIRAQPMRVLRPRVRQMGRYVHGPQAAHDEGARGGADVGREVPWTV